MGPGLADNITQGAAQGDMFRSAPLWGVGQRIFFLHDGRTNDIQQAILAHASSGSDQGNQDGTSGYQPSEANTVVSQFKALPVADKQAILDFLRSL
jgi:CxxC motif-containing protein (DUF1111 family)